jgi:hypothetical protein
MRVVLQGKQLVGLGEDMFTLDAFRLVGVLKITGRIDGIFWAAEHSPAPKRSDKIDATVRNSGKKRNVELVALLTELKLPVALASAKRLSKLLNDEKDTITWDELAKAYEDISARLRDELGALKIFCLDPEREGYFEPIGPLFGQEVADKLPSAIPDIEDAGKCIALQQGTAAVFHLMRIMEAALKELAKLLGIPYAPSWESYIAQIKNKISERPKRKGIKWKKDELFFQETLGDLQAIKIAWRNPTMHIVRRYSVDESDDIFRAVRGFTKRLAPRLKPPKL